MVRLLTAPSRPGLSPDYAPMIRLLTAPSRPGLSPDYPESSIRPGHPAE